MIINLRGTSGSGKSTVVRRIMALYDGKTPAYMQGRRQPTGYLMTQNPRTPLWILGHYETACGGCDTIPTMEMVYEGVRSGLSAGYHVLYEGLLVQSDVKRLIQLHTDGFPIVVVKLDTSIEDCIASIQLRRNERGDPRPIDPSNTIKKDKAIAPGIIRIRNSGVPVYELNREDAFQKVKELLEL